MVWDEGNISWTWNTSHHGLPDRVIFTGDGVHHLLAEVVDVVDG